MANMTVFKDDSRTRERRAKAQAALQRLSAPNQDRGPITDAERAENSVAKALGGQFGLRIEDICVITADGADHFGDWQTGPEGP